MIASAITLRYVPTVAARYGNYMSVVELYLVIVLLVQRACIKSEPSKSHLDIQPCTLPATLDVSSLQRGAKGACRVASRGNGYVRAQ